MTMPYDSGRRRSSSLGTFLFALVLGAVGLALFLRHANHGLSGRLLALIGGRSETVTASVPAVVEQIARLDRLETVVYSLDTVVEGDRSSPLLPDVLAGDRLLLVVHGQSIGGVDLSKLKPESVRIDGADRRSIHVALPPSEVFLTRLDNQHTHVYSRTTGLLVPVDPNLESDTRAEAERQLAAAALADGILDAARRNARSTVEALLHGLGFTDVDVS